jgi:acylphosphatase
MSVMAEEALRIVVTGRVQGVGFRAWAIAEARRRGVRGWVRNRRDGAVEALLIGPPKALDAMVEACRRGPGAARVIDVVEEPASDDGSAGFHDRPTV